MVFKWYSLTEPLVQNGSNCLFGPCWVPSSIVWAISVLKRMWRTCSAYRLDGGLWEPDWNTVPWQLCFQQLGICSFIHKYIFFLKNGQIDIYLPDVQVYHCENETINRKQDQEHVCNNRFHHPTDAKDDTLWMIQFPEGFIISDYQVTPSVLLVIFYPSLQSSQLPVLRVNDICG